MNSVRGYYVRPSVNFSPNISNHASHVLEICSSFSLPKKVSFVTVTLKGVNEFPSFFTGLGEIWLENLHVQANLLCDSPEEIVFIVRDLERDGMLVVNDECEF
jgi:hypothetical protein